MAIICRARHALSFTWLIISPFWLRPTIHFHPWNVNSFCAQCNGRKTRKWWCQFDGFFPMKLRHEGKGLKGIEGANQVQTTQWHSVDVYYIESPVTKTKARYPKPPYSTKLAGILWTSSRLPTWCCLDGANEVILVNHERRLFTLQPNLSDMFWPIGR